MKEKPWNRCDVCGRFIAYADFKSGEAVHQMILPESKCFPEIYETLCPTCHEKDQAYPLEGLTADLMADVLTRIRDVLRNE